MSATVDPRVDSKVKRTTGSVSDRGAPDAERDDRLVAEAAAAAVQALTAGVLAG